MTFLAVDNSVIEEVDVTPAASILIEGHRDFGYDLQTALADIIDNSITAGAHDIKIVAETSSASPRIAIADDGCGMSRDELVKAMTLGSKSPTEKRPEHDLGRFGLGLKTASFSQCRRLSVVTRKGGIEVCARWDLDHVAQRNNWNLEIVSASDEWELSDILRDHGTVVIWEKLDRLVGERSEGDKITETLNAALASAEQHLCLVFHRFMEGRKPDIKLSLNGRSLTPADPFASKNSARQVDPAETIAMNSGTVRTQCFTLPHHKNMTKGEWERIGGAEGHLKSQGFYVYREKRLIIAGGWLGLARSTELTKLCRIQVDIPNTMDAEWKIDVKKASAQLPPAVKQRLKKVVERYLGTSKRTYTARGRKLVDETRYPIWNRLQKDGVIIFQPNLDHPLFEDFKGRLPDELKHDFLSCLRLLGTGLPVDTLHADLVGNAEAVIPDSPELDEIKRVVKSLTDVLLSSGVKRALLADTLKSHAYLRQNWELAKQVIEQALEEIDAE
ncbi:ATP-binding protein [Cohaesibacter marisflavi]|uniref:ATP-binding protein n=1 Tax=Cohaesibacter marisflavi TaxID=655353 RepID=UPI0029C7B5A0|nr:ATP-binding protein [Cohaesibacter marisflavi]